MNSPKKFTADYGQKRIKLEPTEYVSDNAVKMEHMDYEATDLSTAFICKPRTDETMNIKDEPEIESHLQKTCTIDDNKNLFLKTENQSFYAEKEEVFASKYKNSKFKSQSKSNPERETIHINVSIASDNETRKAQSGIVRAITTKKCDSSCHTNKRSDRTDLVMQSEEPKPSYSISKKKKAGSKAEKLSQKKKEELDEALMNLVKGTLMNISALVSPSFKMFTQYCNPSYSMLTEEEITKKIYEEYDTTVESLKTLVKTEAKSVCITVETWESVMNSPCQTEIYQSVAAHFLTTALEFRSILLDVYWMGADNFRVEDASIAPNELLEIWDLNGKVNLVVYDGNENIASAYKNQVKAPQLKCYARTLSSIVKNALTMFEETTEKLRTLSELWEISTGEEDNNIEEFFTGFGSIESPTWLFILKVVAERYDEALVYIKKYEEENKKKYPDTLTQEEVQTCKELHSLMKPFEEVVQFMCSDKYLSASVPIAITFMLLKFLIRFQEQTYSERVTNVLKKIIDGLNEIVPNLEENEVLSMCTFLDPRFKLNFFTSEASAEAVKNKVHELIVSDLKDCEKSTLNMSPSDKTSIWSVFDSTAKATLNIEETARREIEKYLEMEYLSRDCSAIAWWKQKSPLFPNLTKIFRDKCGAVASCAPCKNFLVEKGKLHDVMRSRLIEDHLRQILFLHSNTYNESE